MLKFLARRLLVAVLSLLVFSFITFWAVEALIPGDFFSPFRLTLSAQEVEELRERFGTGRPIYVRWWRWLVGFVTEGLGTTTFGRRFNADLGDVLLPTVFVFVIGLLLAFTIGQWLGKRTGWQRSWANNSLVLGGITAASLFPPFLGYLVARLLREPLRAVSSAVIETPHNVLWPVDGWSENSVMGVTTLIVAVSAFVASVVVTVVWRQKSRRPRVLVTSVLVGAISIGVLGRLGLLEQAADVSLKAAPALIAFTVLAFGEFMLIMQTGMAGVAHEDYVMAARAKGLSERMVRDRHGARNASLAVVARLAVSVPYLLTGLVIVEMAVAWPGIGTFLFRAIDAQDIPAAISTLAVIGVITAVVRFTLDFLTFLLDPRIARPREIAP